MAIISKLIEGLTNDVTYYARVYPINPEGFAQSELDGQVASAIPVEHDPNTLLLLHGEELVDSSLNNATITNSGVSVSAAQSKFGGKSLYFNGSAYLTLNHLDFIPKSGDFTIDWWEYRTASTTGGAVFHQCGANADGLGFLVGFDSKNNFYCQSSGATTAWDLAKGVSMGAEKLNQWVHYALVRSGNTFLLFQNGALYKSFTSSASIKALNAYPVMGAYSYSQKSYFTGYIDEFRISNVARWTGNFTPPTAAYNG